jgi:hypothetical protein
VFRSAKPPNTRLFVLTASRNCLSQRIQSYPTFGFETDVT